MRPVEKPCTAATAGSADTLIMAAFAIIQRSPERLLMGG